MGDGENAKTITQETNETNFMDDFREFYSVTFKNPSTITVKVNNDDETVISTFYYKIYTELQAAYSSNLIPLFLLDNKYYDVHYNEICETTDENLVDKIIFRYGLNIINPSELKIYENGTLKETIKYEKYSKLKIKYVIENEMGEEENKEQDLYKLEENYYKKTGDNYNYLFNRYNDKETIFAIIITRYELGAKYEKNIEIIDEEGDVLESYFLTQYVKYTLKYTNSSNEICEVKILGEEYEEYDNMFYDENEQYLFAENDNETTKLENIKNNLSLDLLNPSYIYFYRQDEKAPLFTLYYKVIEWTEYTLVYYNKNNSKETYTLYETEGYYYDINQNSQLTQVGVDDAIKNIIEKLYITPNNPSQIVICAASDTNHEYPIYKYTYSFFDTLKYTVICNNQVLVGKLKYRNDTFYDEDDTDNAIFTKESDDTTILNYFTSKYTLDNPSYVSIFNTDGTLCALVEYKEFTELVMKIENGEDTTTKTIYYFNGEYFNQDKTLSFSVYMEVNEKIKNFVNLFSFSFVNNSKITISGKDADEIIYDVFNILYYYDTTLKYKDAKDGDKEKTISLYNYIDEYYTLDGIKYIYKFSHNDSNLCKEIMDIFSITLTDPSHVYIDTIIKDPYLLRATSTTSTKELTYDTKIKVYLSYLKPNETEMSSITLYYQNNAFYKNNGGIDYTKLYELDADGNTKASNLMEKFSITINNPCSLIVTSTDGNIIYDTFVYNTYLTYCFSYYNENNKFVFADLYFLDDDKYYYDLKYQKIVAKNAEDTTLLEEIVSAYNIELWDPSKFRIYDETGEKIKEINYGVLVGYNLTFTGNGNTQTVVVYKNTQTGKYYLNRTSNTSFAVICDRDEIPNKIASAYSTTLTTDTGIYLRDEEEGVIVSMNPTWYVYSNTNCRYKLTKGSETIYCRGYYYENVTDDTFNYIFINDVRYTGINKNTTEVNGYTIVSRLMYEDASYNCKYYFVYYCYSDTGKIYTQIIYGELENNSTDSEINIKLKKYATDNTLSDNIRFPEEWHKSPIIIDYIINQSIELTSKFTLVQLGSTDMLTSGKYKIKCTYSEDSNGNPTYTVNDSRVKYNYSC